ncbi:Hypp8408 [Branchiostoma lanceolatum]|uniref:Hypp8408 protein n=1 Tax=Branchiostoma lanceolatum TaxID=7740 RepID=A0A8K0EEL4_BRALA|nr:Hypp8408 [Branchiostoma lanceolatum]
MSVIEATIASLQALVIPAMKLKARKDKKHRLVSQRKEKHPVLPPRQRGGGAHVRQPEVNNKIAGPSTVSLPRGGPETESELDSESEEEDFSETEETVGCTSAPIPKTEFRALIRKDRVCFLKAKVVPGQRVTDDPQNPWGMLKKMEGYVVAAHCTYMSFKAAPETPRSTPEQQDNSPPLRQTCSHIAALLFKVKAAVRNNLVNPACTSTACERKAA